MADEPTLARGMQSADGWVEYLQQLLQHHLGENELRVTGVFDDTTHDKVIEFQKRNGLEPVDGVVGDATWSVLRSEPDRAPVGDSGTGPGYVEKGVELRFVPDAQYWDTAFGIDDAVILIAYSVGTVDPQLDAVHVVAHVSDPEGGSRERQTTLFYDDTNRELQVVVGAVSEGKSNGRYSVLAQLSVDGEPGAEDSVQAEFDVA
jgi:peptidoglycan hydrolase-like protein with peptidoglycan-binding domain